MCHPPEELSSLWKTNTGGKYTGGKYNVDKNTDKWAEVSELIYAMVKQDWSQLTFNLFHLIQKVDFLQNSKIDPFFVNVINLVPNQTVYESFELKSSQNMK